MYYFRMLKLESLLPWLLLLLLLAGRIEFGGADIGTASQYVPPYAPTACFGSDYWRFPTSNLFAAAGEGIWENGAACGRKYVVRCISGPAAQSCVEGMTIPITIVDRAQTSVSRPSRSGTTLVLSNTAFQTIANPTVPYLNVEFQQI
ncbi:EG45-like domain containing protein [Andrographis paniculata]|uniref:EG45-like domain containing protein n=1 Tax=Andrographis paniculata TaxID=175694 RepID=UPI0021E71E33|nr:EG45-like domain containing protein [Andrographis paniculata]